MERPSNFDEDFLDPDDDMLDEEEDDSGPYWWEVEDDHCDPSDEELANDFDDIMDVPNQPCLTNFQACELPIFQKVLKRYEKELGNPAGLYIKREAYDEKGNVLSHFYSLHFGKLPRIDVFPFWKIYDEEYDAFNKAMRETLEEIEKNNP